MNLWDILILLIVAAAAITAVLSMRRRKKTGKSCCGTCEGCGLRGSCQSGGSGPDPSSGTHV